jgi:hypothetical protein
VPYVHGPKLTNQLSPGDAGGAFGLRRTILRGHPALRMVVEIGRTRTGDRDRTQCAARRAPAAIRGAFAGYWNEGRTPGLRRSSYFIHLENGPAVQSSHDFGVNRPQERDAVADERQVAAAAVLAFVGFDFLTALPKFRRSGRSA